MTVRTRFLTAALAGLWIAPWALGQDPPPFDVKPGQVLDTHLPVSTNQRIASTIAEQLRQSGQLQHYTIDVTFRNGTANLTGSVVDQPQREEALRLAQGVSGVERVRDHLTLNPAAPVTRAQASEPTLKEPPTPPKETKNDASTETIHEPVPIYQAPCPSNFDLNPPKMPPYAWPTYAPYDNYSRVAYPLSYPYSSWPYIGPVYPFPQVPLGWRQVKLTWEDGYWFYSSHSTSHDWWRIRYW